MIELIKKELNNNSFMEYTKDNIERFYKKYKFLVYDKETYLSRRHFRNKLLENDISIKDLLTFLNNTYNITLNITIYTETNMTCIFIKYLLGNCYTHLSLINELINNQHFLYRVYIRIVLYKHNWSPESIEKLLIKKFNLSYTYDSCPFLYTYFLIDHFVDKNKFISKKGRKRFPENISNIFRELDNKEKVKIMMKKYNVYNIISKLSKKDCESVISLLSKSNTQNRDEIISIFEELKKVITKK